MDLCQIGSICAEPSQNHLSLETGSLAALLWRSGWLRQR